MLWVELIGIYFGRKSGSISGVVVGGGARYWRVFDAFGVLEEIKSPCGGRG